jgi:uncharacterized protein YggE
MRPGMWDGGLSSNVLSATGQSTIRVSPDTAVLAVGAETLAPSAAEALGANSSVLQHVIQILQQLGLQSSDIQTTGLRLYPEMSSTGWWLPNQYQRAPEILGYHASNSLQVTLRDPNQAGQVLDLAVRFGANANVSLSFELRNEGPTRQAAVEAAVRDAHVKATAMATAAGRALGKALAVSEDSSSSLWPTTSAGLPFSTGFLGGIGGAAAASGVSAGTLTVTSRVYVTYELN